jgi:hypothetical protein
VNFVGRICAGDGEHVVGVLVSVEDQGGGGEHGAADVGRASEGESSKHQLIRASKKDGGQVLLSDNGQSPAHKSCINGATEMHEFILGRGWSTKRVFAVKIERLLGNNPVFE